MSRQGIGYSGVGVADLLQTMLAERKYSETTVAIIARPECAGWLESSSFPGKGIEVRALLNYCHVRLEREQRLDLAVKPRSAIPCNETHVALASIITPIFRLVCVIPTLLCQPSVTR